jgi:hypothetical protein
MMRTWLVLASFVATTANRNDYDSYDSSSGASLTLPCGVSRITDAYDAEAASRCLVRPLEQTSNLMGNGAGLAVGVGSWWAAVSLGASTGAVLGPVGSLVGAAIGGYKGAEAGVILGSGVRDAVVTIMPELVEFVRVKLERFLKYLYLSDDPYCKALETLGEDCDENPTCADVRRTWKAASRRLHPDKLGRNADAEAMAKAHYEQMKLNIAWETVRDRHGSKVCGE